MEKIRTDDFIIPQQASKFKQTEQSACGIMCCHYANWLLRRIENKNINQKSELSLIKKKAGNEIFGFLPGTFPHEISWKLTELKLSHSLCINETIQRTWNTVVNKEVLDLLNASLDICKNEIKLTTTSYTGDMYFTNVNAMLVAVIHDPGKYHWLIKYKGKYFDPAVGRLLETLTLYNRNLYQLIGYQDTGVALTIW